jgi:hypothetical protein
VIITLLHVKAVAGEAPSDSESRVNLAPRERTSGEEEETSGSRKAIFELGSCAKTGLSRR